jgi:hypothetical protein
MAVFFEAAIRSPSPFQAGFLHLLQFLQPQMAFAVTLFAVEAESL